MLNDVVVDTNVWMHANNPKDSNFQSAYLFTALLMASATKLCLDAKGTDEAGKLIDSHILGEYERKVLNSGPSAGANVLSALLSTGRFRRVSLKTTDYARKWAKDHIGKPSDRPFLITAINSKERVLVSNDATDFDKQTRARAKSEFKVTICRSDEGCPLLQTAP